jgi:hypothetical protein
LTFDEDFTLSQGSFICSFKKLLFWKGWNKNSIHMLGKQMIYMQKTGTRSLSLTLYKNQLQMDQRSTRKKKKWGKV